MYWTPLSYTLDSLHLAYTMDLDLAISYDLALRACFCAAIMIVMMTAMFTISLQT